MRERLSKLLTIFIWAVIGGLVIKCALVYMAFKSNPDPQLFVDLQQYGIITVGIVLAACVVRIFVRGRRK